MYTDSLTITSRDARFSVQLTPGFALPIQTSYHTRVQLLVCVPVCPRPYTKVKQYLLLVSRVAGDSPAGIMAKDEPVPTAPTAAKLALDMQMRTRKEHNFSKIEEDLLDPRPVQTNTLTVSSLRSKLGFFNPFGKKTVSRGDLVWLFDNTAFRHSRMSSWQAEFVTAVFEKESANRLVDLAASIARIVGLADDAKERETIEQRLQPFAWDIRVGRNAVISQEGSRKTIKLGATGSEGCSSDVINISSHGKGSFVRASAVVTGGVEGILDMQTYYAGEDGWAIISGKFTKR